MTLTNEQCMQVFGQPRESLIRIADEHTLTVQAWLSSRSPQAKKFAGRGVRASSTGFKLPLLNLALGCNFPTDASAEEIGEEVEALKRFFAERNVPWYWWMNTEPSPKNIGQILQRHGLEYDAPPLPAMIASLKQDVSLLPAYDESIHVWRAESVDDLRAASKIRRIAFRFKEGEALTYFEDMASDWLSDESPARLFLAASAESGGAAVSIGALIQGAGIPGVYVMATLPEYHRKGYGKAILTRLLMEASQSSDAGLIALTASQAGAGLYSQFRFMHLFDFDFYSIPDDV